MSEFVTANDGTTIAFDVQGDGAPIALVHGFGASRGITWRNTGWYQTLTGAGHRVIAIDCRGHGESGKPREIESYEEARMAADIVAVLDRLHILTADVMGYSMGGFLAIQLMHDAPSRVSRAVLAGTGENYFRASARWAETIADGLLASDPATIADLQAREFRIFCERAGNDLKALAACIRRPRRSLPESELRRLPQQVLVVCGAEDDLTGSPEPLAAAFAQGRAVIIPHRNHHSTVGDRLYKDAVVEFLSG
jgi:pimeloyl-ACP methyl ester carboxylesterase